MALVFLVITVMLAPTALRRLASSRNAPAAQTGAPGIRFDLIAKGLDRPLYLTAPASDPRLFIVQQWGLILIIRNGKVLSRPFLDLSRQVSRGSERGLLSVAFHPDYAHNGTFFVNYTDENGDTRVERYSVSADPDVADPASMKPVLFVRQPYANHNGGLVLFGPDGMLYIGMGDGGSHGDPHHNGQNLGTLLGKMLRIDVDHGSPYAIPRDNPFVGHEGVRPEIWAYGLRNPWRFSFDPVAGSIYIADVGQNDWEEIDVAPARSSGLNYGWNIMEGNHCFHSRTCDQRGLILPVLEYGHDQGCSVTGGLVYRGREIPSLRGHYFYGDYCSGWVRSFRYQTGRVIERRDWPVPQDLQISSFGQDAAGELYVISLDGRIYKIAPVGRAS